MIVIPKAPNAYSLPIWNQKNDSDVNGSLWATTGIDFSENEGKVRLGKRLLLNTATADNPNITGYPAGFKVFTANVATGIQIWSVTGSKVMNTIISNPLTDTWTLDLLTNSPTDCSTATADLEVFNNELYIARNSADVSYLSTGSPATWHTLTGAGWGTTYQSFCPFGGRMYNGGSTGVKSWDTSHTVASPGSAFAVTIPDPGLIVTFIRAASNRIWIGTLNTNGGKAYLYEWDGTATQVTKGYRLESTGALSCVIKDDIPYIMDTNGVLSSWNGGTFTKLAFFNRRNNKLLQAQFIANGDRFVHTNGMALIRGKVHILVDGRNYDNTASLEETIPSGIWEYDENRGLTCKYTFGTSKSAGTISDYGQLRIAGAGGLNEINWPSTSATRNGSFLAGISYFTDATTVTSGIFYDDLNDTLQKAGSFITTKQYAMDQVGQPSVQNTWQNLYVLYKKLLDAADKIIVKYRVTEVEPITATITWTSTTTFTVLNSAINIATYWTAGTGGEVEILNGIGAGKCSHITNATFNAGTWTVTVDETYTSASGTAKARFQLWKKLGVITYNSSTPAGVTYDQEGMGDVTNWVQFKVCMIFTGKDEIEKLLIINQNFNPAS